MGLDASSASMFTEKCLKEGSEAVFYFVRDTWTWPSLLAGSQAGVFAGMKAGSTSTLKDAYTNG